MGAAFPMSCMNGALSQDELDGVLDAHERYLKRQRGGRRAIVQSHPLARLVLANRQLSECDFSGSVLVGADLSFAHLDHANLYCCDMRNVDARGADFSHADMRGVQLNGSNLSRARLDHVDFRPGRLIRDGVWVQNLLAHRGLSAVGTDFSYCSISGASFEGAHLENANFTGAIILATLFRGAQLSNAVFHDAVLSDMDMAELQVPDAALVGALLPPTRDALAAKPHLVARLKAHHRWVESDGATGDCASLDGADLRTVKDVLGSFKLTAVSAKRVTAPGVDFSAIELQGANFEGADLRGASFMGADLRGIRLKGARLQHAKFIGADMRPLALKSGECLACDLTEADVSEEQLTEAIWA